MTLATAAGSAAAPSFVTPRPPVHQRTTMAMVVARSANYHPNEPDTQSMTGSDSATSQYYIDGGGSGSSSSDADQPAAIAATNRPPAAVAASDRPAVLFYGGPLPAGPQRPPAPPLSASGMFYDPSAPGQQCRRLSDLDLLRRVDLKNGSQLPCPCPRVWHQVYNKWVRGRTHPRSDCLQRIAVDLKHASAHANKRPRLH